LRCHKFYVAVRPVVYTLQAAGRINNVTGIHLANICHCVRLVGGLRTVITFELKPIASHWSTDHVNQGTRSFISGGGYEYGKVRSHSSTLSERNEPQSTSVHIESSSYGGELIGRQVTTKAGLTNKILYEMRM